ncbi:hypothetical protein [Geodermatophilus sp. SYSU D00815]
MGAVARRLREGAAEEWFVALGTSMRPAIATVQRVRLRRPAPGQSVQGRIALVRVGGRWWLHRVVDERGDRVLVAGDNGRVNGWTPRSEIAGVVVDDAARARPAP